MTKVPLATIGIPTFNRSSLLRVALCTALAQDYPHFEVIVSDNCSDDGTKELCTGVASGDSRVRYIRQDSNRGVSANFRAVLDEAHGDFFMWLADDDALDANYLTECIRALLADPSVALVAGRAVQQFAGAARFTESSVNLMSDDPAERISEYFRCVTANSTFYGVARPTLLRSLPYSLDVPAGDWLFVAAIAFSGRVRTIDTTSILRSTMGISRSASQLARSELMAGWLRPFPLVAIPATVADDILRSSTYDSMERAQRATLAAKIFLTLVQRITIRWTVERQFSRAVLFLQSHLPARVYSSLKRTYNVLARADRS